MKPLLIQLDDQTLSALNRVAAPDKRKRSEFIRQAIRSAIRQSENRAASAAFHNYPDFSFGDGSTAEGLGQTSPSDREPRLHLFDRATERHRGRRSARIAVPATRGWKREDLYDRGRSR
jgi:hypothetical protein